MSSGLSNLKHAKHATFKYLSNDVKRPIFIKYNSTFHIRFETSAVLKFQRSGPSCSKLTTSLVNDSLKFTSSDTQIC